MEILEDKGIIRIKMEDDNVSHENNIEDKDIGEKSVSSRYDFNATLITGATSGIGLELAKIFAKNGHNLVLVARSEHTLDELKKKFEDENGIKVHTIVQDLKYYNAPTAIYDAVKLARINVNILVNNAGFGNYGKFSDTDLETELEMIQVNVTALTHLTKMFLKDMLENNSGRIMNVASTAAFQPGPLMAVYFATKAYVLSFSEALSEELHDTKIRVTALCPGPTNTNFQRSAKIDNGDVFTSKIPSGKEVAEYAYEALVKGKRVAIHGVKNRMLVTATRFAPRKTVAKMVRKINE
jgi:uncharacterized protein